jgi:hypothetical protein
VFKDATRSHDTKLGIITLFPLLLGNLMHADPRYGKDQAYAEVSVISMRLLQADGNALLARLGETGFRELDKWKQRGFYASTTDRGVTTPRESINPTLATLAYNLAWRATTSLDFLLKGGNLERYIQSAQSIRDKLTELEHQALEHRGAETSRQLFGQDNDEPPKEG